MTLQQDWMTELLQQYPHIGRLVWFTVDDTPMAETDWLQAITQAGLAAYGLPRAIAPTTAYLRGLQTLTTVSEHHTLLRRVARGRGRVVHQWIRETVENEQAVFTPLVTIERRSHPVSLAIHPLTPLTAAEDAALQHLTDAIAQAEHTYLPRDRRQQVRQWLQSVGALSLAKAGPVQFIPETATGLVDALTQAQHALGITVWSLPLQRSDDVIHTLAQHFLHETTTRAASLLQRIQTLKATGKDLTLGQTEALVRDYQALNTRVKEYTDLFGVQLEAVQDQLALVQQAVAHTVGVTV